MVDFKLSREEQETVIRGNAASQEWEIVTADPRIIRRMARQVLRGCLFQGLSGSLLQGIFRRDSQSS